ncbi:MAG TPA: poly-gamma-glutamate biosynthesis protein PgsC [Pseudogracilibacillus sp.]|nr:poly-gamma-glutamate biosynthesis protein PgsC [Pseudogracilibacillus sp.]
MFGTDLYVALAVGMVIALLFAEKTGIVPAGLVVPGYLALVFDQWRFLLVIIFISIITYLIVQFGVTRFVILYGRRKFAAMLIVGMMVKLVFDYFYPIFPFEVYEFRGIGIIVPGIIANTIQKQGVVVTLASTLIVSFLTFAMLFIYQIIF